MKVTPRTIATSALAILAVLVACSWAIEGQGFAAGVGISGLLVVANLGLWTWMVRGVLAAGEVGAGPAAMGVYTVLKMLFLFGGVFALCQLFSPAAVAIGASAVGGAVMVLAAVGLVTDLEVGEA